MQFQKNGTSLYFKHENYRYARCCRNPYKVKKELLLDLVDWMTSRGTARDLRHGILVFRASDGHSSISTPKNTENILQYTFAHL